MTTTEQEQFRLWVKNRLNEERMSITQLARKIRKARNTVSQAINHPIFPRVKKMIKTALNR